MMIYDDDVAYSSSHAEDLLYLPMNRTVRRRSVAVPWSLFPRARLARFFLFLFCGEGMPAGHGLWFVLPVHRDKGLTFQFQSFSCGYAVCRISWSVC